MARFSRGVAVIIGLTGGIASGKSTAARHLGTLGAHVIDADRLGHRAYEPGTGAHQAVIEAFGEEVRGADGRIDRKRLGAKVFGDAAALGRLTAIVWPEIRRLAQAEIAAAQAARPDGVVVLEAAVLLEAGWQDAVDETWVVSVDRATALNRAMQRDGADAAAVEARIDAQLANAEREAQADVVFDNSGAEAQLIAQLDAAWHRVTGATA